MSEILVKIDSNLLETFHKYNITLEEFFILKCLYMFSDGGSLMLNYTRGKNNAQKIIMMQPLVRKQFVSLTEDFHVLEMNFRFDSYIVTSQGNSLCMEVDKTASVSSSPGKLLEDRLNNTIGAILNPEKTLEAQQFDDFIRSYLNLFPKGKNGGNKTLRSNDEDVKSKMIKFLNKYKRFTKDDVLKSTEIFLRKFRNDFFYCPTAEYFILKDNSSALASECDSRKRALTEGSEDIEDNSSPFEQLM